jgi:hypothetical protein
MANRHNHYEAAFEAYLRSRTIPYVAVDESRRSLMGDETLKSLDFIVSPPRRTAPGVSAPCSSAPCSWLVDVKGRRFSSGRRRKLWNNWSTSDDLRSLARWEDLFGGQFRGLLVFAYNVDGDLAPLPLELLFEHRGGLYGFVAISLDLYTAWATRLSPKWDTVSMPTDRFRELARPADSFFDPAGVSGTSASLPRVG